MSPIRHKRSQLAESEDGIDQRKAYLHKVVVRVATGAAMGMTLLLMPVIAVALSYRNKGSSATEEHLGDLADYGLDTEDTGPNETFREYIINLGDGDSIVAVEVKGNDSGQPHQVG